MTAWIRARGRTDHDWEGGRGGGGGEEWAFACDACDILYGNRGQGRFWPFTGVEEKADCEASDAVDVMV